MLSAGFPHAAPTCLLLFPHKAEQEHRQNNLPTPRPSPDFTPDRHLAGEQEEESNLSAEQLLPPCMAAQHQVAAVSRPYAPQAAHSSLFIFHVAPRMCQTLCKHTVLGGGEGCELIYRNTDCPLQQSGKGQSRASKAASSSRHQLDREKLFN